MSWFLIFSCNFSPWLSFSEGIIIWSLLWHFESAVILIIRSKPAILFPFNSMLKNYLWSTACPFKPQREHFVLSSLGSEVLQNVCCLLLYYLTNSPFAGGSKTHCNRSADYLFKKRRVWLLLTRHSPENSCVKAEYLSKLEVLSLMLSCKLSLENYLQSPNTPHTIFSCYSIWESEWFSYYYI